MKSVLALVFLLAGCAGVGSSRPDAGHPASPDAPETAYAPPPDRLRGPVPLEESGEPTGQWTCPMHPEVIEQKPGKCPKCGMDLEEVRR
jgi:hypothetical protein